MTTLFEKTNNTPVIDETKDYLEELVGEGKKFKTPQELARGKAEADAFVERLKAEQAALREENARILQESSTRNRLQELLDRLETPPVTNQTPSTPVTNQGEPTGATALTPEAIAEIIDQKVSQRERALIETNNLEYVRKSLTETFGPNYTDELSKKATELGVGTKFLDDLARSQPTAFIALVGAKAPAVKTPTIPTSSVNTAAFAPKPSSGERTQSYYEKIKATDKKAYWSPKVQNQLHQDAIRLGPQFFDIP